MDKGLELVGNYSDTASGKTAPADRVGMAQALADLASGRAGVLLAARADRLTRVTADLYGLMDLSAREGWCIRTADAVVDTCSESGQLMAKVPACSRSTNVGSSPRVPAPPFRPRRHRDIVLGAR